MIEYRHNGRLLYRYMVNPAIAPEECPSPYFHPVCTLAGDEITLYRPWDHVWHKGLAMSLTQVSGQNFWGGATYVRDKGYTWLPNIGRVVHVDWEGDGKERLDWITAAGERWFEERREIRVGVINEAEGYWRLDLQFALKNVSGKTLRIGSPTTQGRPMAGYGGLFWRGPRSFLGEKIFAAGGLEGPGIMGQSAAWLAYTGTHDVTANKSTIVFYDQSTNPRYPTKWFVRNDPYACLSCSFMFDEEYELPNGHELRLNYRILIANGELSPARIEELK
jgi:hypothetical protein